MKSHSTRRWNSKKKKKEKKKQTKNEHDQKLNNNKVEKTETTIGTGMTCTVHFYNYILEQNVLISKRQTSISCPLMENTNFKSMQFNACLRFD